MSTINDSIILEDVKRFLNIPTSSTYFDQDLMLHINSVFFELWQLGIGPALPYYLDSENDTWIAFMAHNDIQMIKSYVCIKVRLSFDPPTSSVLLGALERLASEQQFRLSIMDAGGKEDG